MAEDEDSEAVGPDNAVEASPARTADELAARFGSPDWQRLCGAAEKLAAEFNLPSSSELAEAMVEGLELVRITREELHEAYIDGKYWYLKPTEWEAFREIGQRATDLLALLSIANFPLPEPETKKLGQSLELFCAVMCASSIAMPNMSKNGVRHRRPAIGRPFVLLLAAKWLHWTRKKPVAWTESGTNERKGAFWFFVKAACEAAEVETPSIQSVAGWLKSGLPNKSSENEADVRKS